MTKGERQEQFEGGTWCWDVAFQPAQIHDILVRHGGGAPVIREPLVLSEGAE